MAQQLCQRNRLSVSGPEQDGQQYQKPLKSQAKHTVSCYPSPLKAECRNYSYNIAETVLPGLTALKIGIHKAIN